VENNKENLILPLVPKFSHVSLRVEIKAGGNRHLMVPSRQRNNILTSHKSSSKCNNKFNNSNRAVTSRGFRKDTLPGWIFAQQILAIPVARLTNSSILISPANRKRCY